MRTVILPQQQSSAAVSARKFRQSTGSVLKSRGEENCMATTQMFGLQFINEKVQL